LAYTTAIIYGGALFVSLKSSLFTASFEYLNFDQEEKTEVFEPIAVKHIKTPEPVKAIYMTSWVAGTKNWRQDLVNLIENTELNSIIIDVKDCTGKISFEVDDPVLLEVEAVEKRIPDAREFIEYLHLKGIYVIARISVFQDPHLVKKRPELAVKNKQGGAWEDYKGITWVDPASVEVWDYILRIAKETEAIGFDELNFDYVRFPSDGDMKNIVYDFWDPIIPRAVIIRDFFEYLSVGLKDLDVALSVDLFGMTTSHNDDLNIGQILEYAMPYFDYIAPMVYPSHYPKNFNGYANPADHPYEIIKYAMDMGVAKLEAASSTPAKLRPWLQDFDLGATYDASKVRAQMQATYDAGLTSWMLWDPSNKYTRDALLPK